MSTFSVQVEFVDDLLLPTQALKDIQNIIMYHLVEKNWIWPRTWVVSVKRNIMTSCKIEKKSWDYCWSYISQIRFFTKKQKDILSSLFLIWFARETTHFVRQFIIFTIHSLDIAICYFINMIHILLPCIFDRELWARSLTLVCC